jgi:hypothetical protein
MGNGDSEASSEVHPIKTKSADRSPINLKSLTTMSMCFIQEYLFFRFSGAN